MKNIDRNNMMKVLEDVFRTLLRKKYGDVDNFDIVVNTEKGDLEIWHKREIVEDDAVENPITQIEITEARKIEEDFDIRGKKPMKKFHSKALAADQCWPLAKLWRLA